MLICRDKRGVALIVVLLVFLLLFAIVSEFIYQQRVSLFVSSSLRDREKAYFLAKSGLNIAKYFLSKKDLRKKYLKYIGKPIPIPASSGMLELTIFDEASKILVSKSNAKEIERLFEIIQVPLPDNFYKSLNSMFLLSDIFKIFPKDAIPRIKSYLTIYTDGHININTAKREVLLALSPNMTQGVVFEIISKREEGTFKKLNELKSILGNSLYYEIFPEISVSSHIYRIESLAKVRKTYVKLEAVLNVNTGKTLFWRVI